LPDCAGYSASKAGLVAWGEALRASLRGSGVGVTVISPGFFDSAMGDRFEGSRPLLMSMDAAAGRIHRGILGGRGRLVFPWPLGALLRVLALLPPGIGDWAIRRMRFRVRPEAP
jgi:short-subunit dehydrogenase